MNKFRGVHRFSGIRKLASVGFIFALAAALFHTIWASYLDSIVHSEMLVGLITSLLTFSAFMSYFLFIPLIEKYDKAKLLSLSLIILAFSYIALYFSKNLIWVFIFSLILTISGSLKVTSFGILVRDISSKKNLSQSEGFIYSLLNSAWVVGPLLAGVIITYYTNNYIFLFSALFTVLSFFVFGVFHFKDVEGKKRIDKNIRRNFIDFFKNKDRTTAYFIGAGVTAWWSLIYVFIPLLILRSGLHEKWIGYFIFAVAIPLIILEYPFSKISNKYGFKKMFLYGYGFAFIIAVACFFIASVEVILILLILAGIGLAAIEPSTEAYFFDLLKGKEEYRFYGPYNTAIDIGQFLGTISATIILLFLPFKFIFIVYAGWMLFFFCLSFFVKNVIESKRKDSIH